VGLILDMVAISRDVEGVSYEELGWHVNLCLLRLFTAPVRARHFASSVITPLGYKASGHPCATYVLFHDLPLPPRLLPYMAEKKER
jgi:hypothetical protein